jgi:putative DNA-invertase from lambdoid prophage Rac
VGQFQRDLQNELTRDGLAAARAAGAKSGRRPPLEQLGAFLDGTSIAAPAREHDVSRVAVRTGVADLMPGHAIPAATETKPVQIEIPGTIARHLTEHEELGKDERRGREVRCGAGLQPPRHRPARRAPDAAHRRCGAGHRPGVPGPAQGPPEAQGLPDLPNPAR